MSQRRFYLLHLLLLCLSLLPLWLVDVPAFVDYPNHLARAFIAHHWASDPVLRQNYWLHWHPAPYILFYILVDMLQYLVGIYTAGKLVLSLCFVLNVAGVLRLSRYVNQGRPSAVTFLMYPLLYNMPYAFGFVSFALGSSMALFAFSFILQDSDARRIRYAMLAAFSTLIYFTHLPAWSLFMLVTGLYTVKWVRIEPAFCIKTGAALLAVPVLVKLLVREEDFQLGTSFNYGQVYHKLDAFFSPIRFLRNDLENVVLLIVWVLLLCGIIRVAKPYCPLLFALLAVAVLTPFKVLSVAFLDVRLPPLLALLFLGLAHFHWQDWRRKTGIWLLGLFAVLACGRQALILERMVSCDTHFTALRTALRTYIDPGKSLVFFNNTHRLTESCKLFRAQDHIANLGVIENDLYIPNTFAGMPPVYPADKYKTTHYSMAYDNCLPEVVEGQEEPVTPYYWHNYGTLETKKFAWTPMYDYALYFNSGRKAETNADMRLLYEDKDVQLYRLVKP